MPKGCNDPLRRRSPKTPFHCLHSLGMEVHILGCSRLVWEERGVTRRGVDRPSQGGRGWRQLTGWGVPRVTGRAAQEKARLQERRTNEGYQPTLGKAEVQGRSSNELWESRMGEILHVKGG
ncbi:hypothetical protein BS17DRAFT_774734 [Gyrodon lividus]|nr:hypothetical protein BS17DRAFT_774734 [Gyrodon lividus]